MNVASGEITLISTALQATVLTAVESPTTAVSVSAPNPVNVFSLGVGVQGPPGPTGPASGSPGTYIASQNLLAGQPIRISRATGQAGLASASVYTDSFVMGFALTDAVAGYPVSAQIGCLHLPDWTAIAGTPILAVGMPYFLAAGGGITLTVPAKPLSVASAIVGRAATPTILFIELFNPLLL